MPPPGQPTPATGPPQRPRRAHTRRTPRTLQTRLALLYTGLFFVSGLVLLVIPLLHIKSTQRAGTQGAPAVNLVQPLTGSLAGLIVLVVLSAAFGWLMAGRVLAPLRAITATARDISAGDLHRRLSLAGRDNELKELGETLDDLFARLEASFASQRHFVANASHELRTPLAAERTLLQVALADPEASAETLRSVCADVLALGEQTDRLIEALLTLASSERGLDQRETVDLAEVTRDAVEDRRPEASHLNIQLSATLAPALAAGEVNLVRSLVANLLDNALRYNVAGGRVEVTTAMTAGRAAIAITNTGAMIPPDQVGRLFEPFQRFGRERTRSPHGHGLGLAIVQAIARAHGATLAARARPEGGLDIEVRFP